MSIPFIFKLKCDIFLNVEDEMIENTLSEMLKKYINIFINEYKDYLSKDQLETLRTINYHKIINLENLDVPFGLVSFGKIRLSNISNDLINSLQKMDNYNTTKYNLNNKNISSYLKYMCENGYSSLEYFGDILMYFVFELVLKNPSIFNHGLINQEIRFLSIKYSLRSANLYAKEETIATKITPLFGLETMRKILFMDKPTAFLYLNKQLGFITNIVDEKNKNIKNKDYQGFEGFLNYADDYDEITYGDAYNYLLDFEVENKLNI